MKVDLEALVPMEAVKRIYLEPAWKLHSAYDSLLRFPPAGYEFVTEEGTAERGIKLASKWGPSYWLLAQASRVAPVSLLKSLASRFKPPPTGVCLTYAPAHVVLRKEPWILDMQRDSPCVLAVSDARYSRRLWNSMTRRILASPYCRKIVCRFNVDKDEFTSYFGDERVAKKVEVIYWGVTRKEFVKEYSQDKVKLLFIDSANMNTHEHFALKGGYELLAAFQELSQSYDNLELVLRSAVPPNLKKELSHDQRVKIIDRPVSWSELEQEWRSADIFVLPTWVTPSQVLLDALSFGLPIVTTNAEANPEIVADGRTGFLVPGRTAMSPDREVVQALCRKLSILIENPELRRRMGAEARRTAEDRFSMEKRNQALRRVLDEAMRVQGE